MWHSRQQWKFGRQRELVIGIVYHRVLELFLKIVRQEYQGYLGKMAINGVSLGTNRTLYMSN
jgi:hypothetical protein